MRATEFVQKSTDPEAWRKHSRALRRSGDVLWDDFVNLIALNRPGYQGGQLV